ncbi:MAG: tRNA dihydrouridine synthase DusB [Magnetospiraceae bacterium]
MTLNIGGITLQDPVILAPMSGVTDMPFRRLVKRYGAGLVVSEMIASQAMIRQSAKSRKIADTTEAERPIAIQLAGNEPDVVAEAAKMMEGLGAALIDINMGCPVKKVVKGYAGSHLMRNECLAGEIIEATVKAVSVPVTVKMRLGWDDHNRNAAALARIAEQSGAKAVTVHGRTRAQFYKGTADWAAIGEVKRAVSVPVIGNGDVTSVERAREMLDISGADGVMVGRATYGRPWFPRQVAHYLATGEHLPDPSPLEQMQVVLEHYESMLEHHGTEAGLRIARKHLSWYSKGFRDSAEFRSTVNHLADPEAVRDLIRRFYTPEIDRDAA